MQAHNEQPFCTYPEGSIIGDSDALLELNRDCKAFANEKPTTLYQIKIEAL
jgi:hypothetical protein